MTPQVAYFRDTVSPQLIGTSTCDGVLAYANGAWSWPAAEVHRFIEAGKRVHLIDVNASAPGYADILDVERFDATVDQAPGWVERRVAKHSTAAIYIERSNVRGLVAELAMRPCYLIVADWTGKPHIPAGLDLPPWIVLAATQYANHPNWDDVAVYSREWLEGKRL